MSHHARTKRSFWADLSAQAAIQGLIVAVVGYMSSVAIVIQGLAAAGASAAQITSALLFLGLAKGIVAIGLSLGSRMPVSIAWTTPGMALLGATGAVVGGFPAVIGAFIATGALIIVAGFWQPLSRFILAIPKAIANAMLAGILFKLCLAPFVAIQQLPLLSLAIIGVWLIMLKLARLWAVPAAVVVALVATGLTSGFGQGGIDFALPRAVFVMPAFSVEAMFGIALPLFVVTMASQNITGLAVLSTFGFNHPPRAGLAATGFASVLTAPFGAPPINYAAITAAMCASAEAHPDPSKRYVAAVFSGIGYILFVILAAVAASVVLSASPLLIEAAAGLALISAFGGAMNQAISAEESRIPALLTFFVSASGLTLFGIGGAFWGLLLGWAAYRLFMTKAKP